MNLCIEDARPGDLDGLTALYRHLHTTDDQASPESLQAAWRELMDNKAFTVLAARMDGRIVASCILVIAPNLTRGARPWAVIENVVTHPDYRRRGLGHAVLMEAVERARQQRCYKVMLMTGRRDEGTLSFYEKAGFISGDKTGFVMRL